MTARITADNLPDEKPKKALKLIKALDDTGSPIKAYRRRPLLIMAAELKHHALIDAPGGNVTAKKGDFILLDEAGHIYPCEKTIFHHRHDGGKELVCLDCGKKETVFPGQIEYATNRCFDCFKKDDPAPVKTKTPVFRKNEST